MLQGYGMVIHRYGQEFTNVHVKKHFLTMKNKKWLQGIHQTTVTVPALSPSNMLQVLNNLSISAISKLKGNKYIRLFSFQWILLNSSNRQVNFECILF